MSDQPPEPPEFEQLVCRRCGLVSEWVPALAQPVRKCPGCDRTNSLRPLTSA